MKTLKVKWIGLRPLIMTNPQTIQLSNPYGMRSRELNAAMKAARKKGDENRMQEIETQSMRVDWESSAYWDAEAKRFYLPDTCVLGAIRAGAMVSRRGKDIETAVIMPEIMAYVENAKSFSSLDAYYKDSQFMLACPCKLPPKTGSLVWKARCMMPTGWTLTFTLEYEENLIAEKTLMQAMIDAGALKGVGGWRPKFGRFLVEKL
jgi:hypothetical protein